MFTSLPFPESSARREGKGGREEGQSRDAEDAGRVVHSVASREATGNRGGSVLCPVPSLLLCQSDPYCFVCVCVSLCVGKAHILPAACYSPSSGTPTSWHAARTSRRRVYCTTTGCSHRNLLDSEKSVVKQIMQIIIFFTSITLYSQNFVLFII